MCSCIGKLVAHEISSVCDTFETCHHCIELAYVSGVIPIFYPNPDSSHFLFADLIW